MKKFIIPILFLVSCTNQQEEVKQSHEVEIQKIDMDLNHKMEILDYYTAYGSRYDYDTLKTYRAYQADSLGLSSEDKVKYINK